VGEAFGDVGLGLGDDAGVGEGEACDVAEGEGCDAGEVVGVPVVRGPQAVASAAIATSHTTDLPLSLEHSLSKQTVHETKRF
jgi:hypothetical protein